MQKIFSNSTRSGFSLVQLSAVVAVAGIVAVSLLPGGGTSSDTQKKKITKERMETIEKATESFMARNFRRPCPSDGGVSIENERFGLEGGAPGICPEGEIFTDARTKIVVGTVPVKALGLSNEHALDGYGRRIMYFVDKRATIASSGDSRNGSCLTLQSRGRGGALRIAKNFDDRAARDKVMWALVSYGKDGHGSFPIGGSTQANRMNVGTNDRASRFNAINVQNIPAGIGFGDTISGTNLILGQRLVQASANDSFDDIVWYNEDTKNTCATGWESGVGFKISRSGTNLSADKRQSMRIAKGDVNGDGIEDLIISNYLQRTVYVLYGSTSGWPANLSNSDWLDLDTMITGTADGTRGFKVVADANYVNFGYTLATGDVNGDNFDDIIISSAQRYLIVYGNSSKADITGAIGTASIAHATNPTTSRTVLITGNTSGLPGPIATGDVNGDGYDDVVFNDLSTGVSSVKGRAYVLFGKPDANWGATNITLSAINSGNGFRLLGSTAGASLINDDNMFAMNNDKDIGDNTAANLLLGNETPSKDMVELASFSDLFKTNISNTESNTFTSNEYALAGLGGVDNNVSIGGGGTPVVVETDTFGVLEYSLAVGDVNGDGLADIVYGGRTAQNGGKVYLLFGNNTASWSFGCGGGSCANINLRTATAIVGTGAQLTIASTDSSTNKFLGQAVHVADIDNDGIKDIITTTRLDIYVIKGTNTYNPAVRDISSSSGVRAEAIINLTDTGPIQYITTFGLSTGDINNDGRNEIVMGDYAKPATLRGSVYALFSPANWTGDYALSTTTVRNRLKVTLGDTADHNSYYMHHAITMDINSDGKMDLVISVPNYDNAAGERKGAVYVLYGRQNASWVSGDDGSSTALDITLTDVLN